MIGPAGRTGVRIPEVGSLVRARGEDLRAIGAKGGAGDRPLMDQRLSARRSRSGVPYLGGLVPAAGDDPAAIRTVTERENSVPMFSGTDHGPRRCIRLQNGASCEPVRKLLPAG